MVLNRDYGVINEKSSHQPNNEPDVSCFLPQMNKITLRSFQSSDRINEKGDGPYRGFGYLSLLTDPIDLTTWSQRELM